MYVIQGLFAILLTFTFSTILIGYLARRHERYLGYWAAVGFLISLLYAALNYKHEYVFLYESPIASAFKLDGLSLFFIVVFLVVAFVSSIHSVSYMEHDRNLTMYYALMQLMMLGLIGLALSDDLFTFIIFWEAMAISSYVLVAFRCHLDEPVEASVKYLIMSGIGGLLLLYATSLIYGAVGSLRFERITEYISTTLTSGPSQSQTFFAILIASLLLIGFGIKAAYFPLHTWLPDAHPAAPSPISALLSGIVIKAGILGIIKFTVPLMYVNKQLFGIAIQAISLLTMTIANLTALMQSDIKRLLAYSSIANIGFILIGVATAIYGTLEYGITSALSHTLSHALGKGLAFLAAGAVIYSMETRELAKMEGFGKKHPLAGLALSLALLSLAGFPPLPGFWSKWFLFLGTLSAHLWILTLIGVFNSVLAGIYYVWLIQRFFFGEPTEDVINSRRVAPAIKASLIILVLVMLAIGLYPQLLYQISFAGAEELSKLLSRYF